MANEDKVGGRKLGDGDITHAPSSTQIVVMPTGGDDREALIDELRSRGHHVLETDTNSQSDVERLLEARVRERTATLQQIKAQWEQAFDAVGEPLAVLDEDYRLVRVNRAYAGALGMEIVAVPGRRCFELRAPEALCFADSQAGEPCAGCPVPGVWRRGGAGSALLLDGGGRRWAVAAYPVRIDDRMHSVVVRYRDVTGEHAQHDRLARESKATAVGNLAGAIAHELNSPMTSIMVFSESLARKTAEGSELNENALEINAAARRCRRLIQGLLRFARRPLQREEAAVDLGLVVDEIRPLLAHRLDIAKVDLDVDLPLELPRVCGQVGDVEHLLVDLLVNALDACEAGDKITVSGREHGPAQVELIVEDTGAGMDADVLAQALTPFFTTKREGDRRGTGLGLTTCEAIVAQMGGTITLESTLGKGTKAVLHLPRYDNGEADDLAGSGDIE